MIEIIYSIDDIKTSMFTAEEHTFYLNAEEWVTAGNLSVGDKIATRCGTLAEIAHIKKIKPANHVGDLKTSQNHNYFVTTESMLTQDRLCDKAPIDSLELIPYQLANRPSKLPNGKPAGNHSGPWVAARYSDGVSGKEVIGIGCAINNMCAEDVAVNDLKDKLGETIALNRGNVHISHAYVRKYTREKGRIVNTMSPCIHCRDNYGSALNDKTVGKSKLLKDGRGYLPPG